MRSKARRKAVKYNQERNTMPRDFKDALKHRRSYYALSDKCPITDGQVKELVDFAVTHVPSAFNSQSTRIVLLLGDSHRRLWDITKSVLKAVVPSEAFTKTEAKIDGSFRSGHGTVLFFEDNAVVRKLQNGFPMYADNFPTWSMQTSAMHQLAVWTMLEDCGLGASLQHYNPLIDDLVRKEWGISPDWMLVAQMPFGTPVGEPGEKEFDPIERRVLTFG